MICLLDPTDFTAKLARHLVRRQDNERIEISTYGLLAPTLAAGFREMRLLSAGCRTATPGVHGILSPSVEYDRAQSDAAWRIFEEVLGLEDQPYIEALHLKRGAGGRIWTHVHRVYHRLDAKGHAVSLGSIAAKAEMVARRCEDMAGERPTSGNWNRAVIKRLERDGELDLANRLRGLGFWEAERKYGTSRAERAMTERLADMSADEAKRRAYLAWTQSTDSASLASRLHAHGLYLCLGDAGKPMVITDRGSPYRLAAAVASGAKAAGAKGTIKARDIHGCGRRRPVESGAARSCAHRTGSAPG